MSTDGKPLHTLDTLIKEYVGPVARAAGLTRRGRTLRLAADNGDQALLEFTRIDAESPSVAFYVQFSIAPLPYWAWVNGQGLAAAGPVPDSSAAMVSCTVVPPPEAARYPDRTGYFRNQWAFDALGGAEPCGLALARILSEEAVPQMRRLVDRQALLEEMRKPSLPLVLRLDPERREIVLRIESASSSEIQELLSRVDPTAPAREQFERWVRDRLVERGQKDR